MYKNEFFKPGPAFGQMLLMWDSEENNRSMPWKGETNPYRIWLSEIILQQTRVGQGLAYYNRFITTYPAIEDLAAAPDDQVMKLWEGLGYYSRCRNLLVTARAIVNNHQGNFPNDYATILSLKGIGPYTAAAIASFAFGLPYAVVDGNVFRVLARIYGIGVPADSTPGKKYFTELADQLLDTANPARYNQAIMDFGAVICKPALPECSGCVFNKSCYAFLNGAINQFPVKENKVKVRQRWFYYLVIESEGNTLIRQRTEKGIWQQLYEFPVIETPGEEELPLILDRAEELGVLSPGHYKIITVSRLLKQQLSHQLIMGRFIRIKLSIPSSSEKTNGQWIKKSDLKNYAFPVFINQYFEEPDSTFLLP